MTSPFRPILPAERQERGPPISSVHKRRIRADACEACRRFKTKCNGVRPTCGACLKRLIDCQYVETESRQARRKYEDLRNRRSAHEELMSFMKTLPEQDALELFRRIRAGGDLQAILNRYKDGDLLLQLHVKPETRLRYELPYSRNLPERLLASGSPYLVSKIYEVASQRPSHPQIRDNTMTGAKHHTLSEDGLLQFQSQYVKPYHAAILVDPRLQNARPSEWTTVCRDDVLMRELLAAYFTHEYHLLPYFQKDYFLEDMANSQQPKKLGIPLCSKLLVNVTLAHACFCYEKIPNRFRYWDPESLGYRFFAEAKRIWELQVMNGQHRSLTSIQAAMLINVIYSLYGLDKLGNIWRLQGLDGAKEMQLFGGNAGVASDRARHAMNFTAWCIFNAEVHFSWHFTRPAPLETYPEFLLPDPSANSGWYGDIWTRYPVSSTLSPTYFGQYFKARSDYKVIHGRICLSLFGQGSNLPAHQAMVFVFQLQDWFRTLPAALTPKNIVLPAHFLLHLEYHMVLMTVCQPFIHEQWVGGLSPRNLVSNAERDINILLRLYYLRHGFAGADPWLTAPLAKIGFMSLQSISSDLEAQDLYYLRSSLFLALRGLREQGRNYYISRTVHYIVRNQIRPEEAELLRGTEDPESGVEESPGLVGEIQSAWVPLINNISDDPFAENLSKLARGFLTLETDSAE